MTLQALEEKLKMTFDDHRLSTGEKYALKEVLRPLAASADNRAFIRNRAFEMVTNHVESSSQQRREAMDWLRQIIKLLDGLAEETDTHSESAWFAPGPDCVNQVIAQIRDAHKTIDACVFTISDNDISEQLIGAHRRDIQVRIITDDEKTLDTGSDVRKLHRAGIPVRLDNDPSHMHHKFAIFDSARVINGSFNWTRSATTRNHEDITLTTHRGTVTQFCSRFELLWQQFAAM